MSDNAKEQWSNIGGALLHWRLAIFKGVNGAVLVALGAIMAGLSNENWAEMDGQARFLFCCGVGLAVLKSVDMLLDQTIGNLRKEDPAAPNTGTPVAILSGAPGAPLPPPAVAADSLQPLKPLQPISTSLTDFTKPK